MAACWATGQKQCSFPVLLKFWPVHYNYPTEIVDNVFQRTHNSDGDEID